MSLIKINFTVMLKKNAVINNSYILYYCSTNKKQ